MTSLPVAVTSPRLVLPLVTPEEAADMLAGRRRPGWHDDYPRPDDRDAASMVRPGDTWGPRHIVRGATVLGGIGFFGPPDVAPGSNAGSPPERVGILEVEVGYGLVEQARGWGFATEALQALLAEADRAGVRVRASVEPDNKPSIRVLAKCGFTELRGADEDGKLVMARPLPRVSPRP